MRYAQSLQGLSTIFSRAPMPEASPAQQAAIRKALVGLGASDRQTEAGGVIPLGETPCALPVVPTCYCCARAPLARAPIQKMKTEVTIAMKDFAGKFAVITGGGTGMGRELARQLVAEGCNVAMCDVSLEAMAETRRLCEAEKLPQGLRVTTHVADVSIEAHLQRFRDELIEQQTTDKIHLLFNNAGIGGGGSLFTNTREQRERTFNICWGGVYLGVRTFLPLMMKADEAHIVNTSSVNGFWASVGLGASHTAYSAAKFAVKGFTEALMTDLRLNAPHIKCSVVMPGHIGTSIVSNSRKIQSGTESEELSPNEILATRQRLKGMGIDTAPM